MMNFRDGQVQVHSAHIPRWYWELFGEFPFGNRMRESGRATGMRNCRHL